MAKLFACFVSFTVLFVTGRIVVEGQPVQCEKLSVPDHGSINATDSNNLYSKVTYKCDPGYSVKGPPSKECLPVPHPHAAIWVPQDVTTCVPDVMEAYIVDSDPVIIYDPDEDELPLMDLELSSEDHVSAQEEEELPMSYVEHMSDSEVDSELSPIAEDDEWRAVVAPPSLELLGDDEMPMQRKSSHDNMSGDELCASVEDIPDSYWCKGEQREITSIRWFMDSDVGECVKLELCGGDREISVSGLFTSYEECASRCMS